MCKSLKREITIENNQLSKEKENILKYPLLQKFVRLFLKIIKFFSCTSYSEFSTSNPRISTPDSGISTSDPGISTPDPLISIRNP